MSQSPPVQRLLHELENRNCRPKRSGRGWLARCPAHEDKDPSLSVWHGKDGRAMVKCFGGCTLEMICDATGLKVVDLMVEKDSQQHKVYEWKPRTFRTASKAVESLEAIHGPRARTWIYHDKARRPVGVIVRWDLDDGKVIRPVAKTKDGWVIGGMPEPRPLYKLPLLDSEERVFITEGEKAADAAWSIGLPATTSAHGSQSPEKTDWSPLSGKECVILPDFDVAGIEYAAAVAKILLKLPEPARVKIVILPVYGDVFDWIKVPVSPSDLRLWLDHAISDALFLTK